MSKKLIYLACFAFALSLGAGVAVGGVEYADPLDGWTYIYTGDQDTAGDHSSDTTSLDGTWGHNNGSDQLDWNDNNWEIGQGDPGGIKAITEGDVTFLRMQDCGDPRDHGMGDPSNRKIVFTHQLTQDPGIDEATADQILTVIGVTLSFRARLSTTGLLDDQYPDSGGENTDIAVGTAWPAGGNGYACHDGGKDIFSIHQAADGDKNVSFALTLPSDPWQAAAGYMEGKQGLTMNCLVGTSPGGSDLENAEGTLNILEIDDLTVWHEFWINIEPDTSGGGTHKVTIYMDGLSTGTVFHLTAGDEGEEDYSEIGLGIGDTNQMGAVDVDFFAYKQGIIAPAPADPEKARAVAPIPGTIVDLPDAGHLGWIAGESAVQHDVYFGTNLDDVNDADITDTTGIYRSRQELVIYTPPQAPELGRTYYWRIDEVRADDTIYKGDVWSFTVIDHLLVDDFEDYNDYTPDEIFSTWLDGYGVETNGALVGHDADFSQGEHIVETTIVHGGKQSMPYYYNNIGAAAYSEAERAFSPAQDWTREGVGVLSLWFRGYPAYLGSFVEGPTGTYTMTAEGADIWGNSDEFHFAWKEISGAGSIVAKVESVSDTDPWAKAGVMIRDTLEPGSRHAMVVVTPGNGVAFQYRDNADGTSSTAAEETGITAPQWVKLERTVGGLVRGYYSADGNTWTQLGIPQTVTMNMPMYVGLALTSHNSGVACEAKFSNITSEGTGQWIDEDIGLLSNEVEPVYVTVKDSSGTAATVYHDDPDASLINTWTEWKIDLKEFGDAGVVLTDISNLAIGFGGADDPQPGGLGLVFFDDIRLYVPRPVDPGDNGLVAYYAFENNTEDGSDNGLHGTVVGDPTYVEGPAGYGMAMDFDGTDDLVELGKFDVVGGITLAAWIKADDFEINDGRVISKAKEWGENDHWWMLSTMSETSLRFRLKTDDGQGTTTLISDPVLEAGVWAHVVAAWDGSMMRIYKDGVEVASQEKAGSAVAVDPALSVAIGSQPSDAFASDPIRVVKFFDGLIDEVRIYNRALSDLEVRYLAGDR